MGSDSSSWVDPVKASTLLKLERQYLEPIQPSSSSPRLRLQGVRVSGLHDDFCAIWSAGRVVGVGTADLNEEDIGQEKVTAGIPFPRSRNSLASAARRTCTADLPMYAGFTDAASCCGGAA